LLRVQKVFLRGQQHLLWVQNAILAGQYRLLQFKKESFGGQ
jgi:hypothetical protein